MTYKEWMSATGARFNLTESDIDLILVNQNIDADEDVDVKKAKTALCNEFSSIIPLANVSEGGYSVSWNMEAIKLWYRSACAELGIVNSSSPCVRNRSNIW